ncbi:hypothetical protein SAMN05216490_3866 [Mucilaginibacter mallensis]|uniref:Uncharacterized protein n=1 Tax=Mucilaginibacter mallensis TaxID=652787 RepID=A0A1H2B281_MUCMA|nr:hypothetical protein [Mucilaginibacter mallensis]SDT52298.1 hypothetical protein SAMN05216490_3866 [Mucilaginibacter mallensis]
MLPTPVTSYAGENSIRHIDKNLYKERILQDIRMHDIPALIEYGNEVFEDLTDLIDLTDHGSIQQEEPSSFLSKNFLPLNDVATSFYLDYKPHNGLLSLKRGFYKLLPIPKSVIIINANSWKTTVLYNEGLNSNVIYKHDCHVGPLTNGMAIHGNLTIKKSRQFTLAEQEEFIQKIVGKTIYVSSSEMVAIQTYKETFTPKEVLWFTW